MDRPNNASQGSAASSNSSQSPGVPLLDVKRQYEPLREKLIAAVTKVCDSGRYILGPECEELERAVAHYTVRGTPSLALPAATHCFWR